MKYKKEVKEFIRKNFAEFHSEVIDDYSERYFISVNGKSAGHFFSIDLDTFRNKNIVAFYSSYEDDIVWAATDENLNKIFEVALKIKRFGIHIKFIVNGEDITHSTGGIFEEPLTPERAVQIYREHKLSCGEEVLPCILECSNFDGSINFSVQVF